MAKRFYGNGFASVQAATRFFSSARTVIADTATAASDAGSKPAGNSGSGPTNGTNRARKGNSIITTASGSTGVAAAKDQAA